MRIESSVISISWIPSEAIKGLSTKLPFEMGVTHYDDPLPDVVDDLEALRRADAFRFANELRAFIDVDGGRIVDYGHLGKGHIGSTMVKVGSKQATFQAVAFPDLRPDPEVTPTSVRFVQTAGGRTGLPAPRRVRRKPFVQFAAPTAWTTLALTIHSDGRSELDVGGASPFPRHWIYGPDGRLARKSGLIDFKSWYRRAFGKHTPWGDVDSPALVTEVESALERELSRTLMGGRKKPRIRKVKEGAALTEQGQAGDDVFLLLDGVLRVEVDGERLAELGPGALTGLRSALEGGTRTATNRAVTACKVAVVRAVDIDRQALLEVSRGHRREERSRP